MSRVLACSECQRPRVLYAERKVKLQDVVYLDAALDSMLFSCGSTIQDLFYSSVKLGSDKGPYEVNRRAVLAAREVGSGHAALEV